MSKRIGFIGCGNMAQAIIEGMLKSEFADPSDVRATAVSDATISTVSEKYQIEVTNDNQKVAAWADIVVLAVKPDQYTSVIHEIRDAVKEDIIIITIAAGTSLKYIEEQFGRQLKVVRTMPNTPSLVGEGMSALCTNDAITAEEEAYVVRMFESFGKAELIPEALMDAVPAVSGSSPAYVYMFIETLADGAVKQGFARPQAYRMAAQAVLGAAKMVLETGKHPGELKDQVCSPGGATIEAVTTLEKNQFRGSIIEAMDSCMRKSSSMLSE
ncbi:pyrroline-5-carboxylate reductase [Bacillus solimangrovi]|uniref:Pyrroline-5-carboxylate reductase n=1 Tax=Bacillus solimangrovi TaxID=1305675 RepID=A0A1E5LJR3_9BACI|nr:pyrroline-5-carboxylate reductase [Bacillus solimangrovi]OEH94315.1 pyrroline-5-carboxylate reductase [Bacillus solimangrovi]